MTLSILLDNIVQLQSSCFLCFVLFCFLRRGEWSYVAYVALASFLNLLSLRITDVCLPPFLEAILFTKGLFVQGSNVLKSGVNSATFAILIYPENHLPSGMSYLSVYPLNSCQVSPLSFDLTIL